MPGEGGEGLRDNDMAVPDRPRRLEKVFQKAQDGQEAGVPTERTLEEPGGAQAEGAVKRV